MQLSITIKETFNHCHTVCYNDGINYAVVQANGIFLSMYLYIPVHDQIIGIPYTVVSMLVKRK